MRGPIIGAFYKPLEAYSTTNAANNYSDLKDSINARFAYPLIDGATEPHLVTLANSTSYIAFMACYYGDNIYLANPWPMNFIYRVSNTSAGSNLVATATFPTQRFQEQTPDRTIEGDSKTFKILNNFVDYTPRVYLFDNNILAQILFSSDNGGLVRSGFSATGELGGGLCVELPYNQELVNYKITAKTTNKNEIRTLDGILRTSTISQNIIKEISLTYKFNDYNSSYAKLQEILTMRARNGGPLLYIAPENDTEIKVELLSITSDPEISRIEAGIYQLNIMGEFIA